MPELFQTLTKHFYLENANDLHQFVSINDPFHAKFYEDIRRIEMTKMTVEVLASSSYRNNSLHNQQRYNSVNPSSPIQPLKRRKDAVEVAKRSEELISIFVCYVHTILISFNYILRTRRNIPHGVLGFWGFGVLGF